MVTMIDVMLQVFKRLDVTYGVRDQPGVACVLFGAMHQVLAMLCEIHTIDI